MKAIKKNNSRGLPIGANIEVLDNSGAKKVRVISVKGFKSIKRKLETATIGDMITAHVVEGKPDMKHTVVKCVIVKQKQEFRRMNGDIVKFQSNGAVVLKDNKGNPKGTVIKGVIAKEVAERFPAIGRISNSVI